jgi:phosphoenolpyruvate-protein kinase (PTS system EI component)
MADVLIRDVPEDVVAAIDAKAHGVGLSRTEYLRRTLARESQGASVEVSFTDFADLASTFADLDDPEVMGSAWR